MHNKSSMKISCPRHLLKTSIYMFVKCLRKQFYRDPDSGSLGFDVLRASFPVKRLLPLHVVYSQKSKSCQADSKDFLAAAFCFAKQFSIEINYVVFSLMLSLFFTLVGTSHAKHLIQFGFAASKTVSKARLLTRRITS